MNFKKVFAGVCAGAMVASMSVCAFADDVVIPADILSSDDYGDFINPAAFVDDLSKVAKVSVNLSCDADSFGGIINIAADSNGWAWAPVDYSNETLTKNADSTYTLDADCALASTDSFAKIGIQCYWGGPVTINGIALIDADGNSLYTFPAASDDDTVEPTVVDCVYTDGKTPSYSCEVLDDISSLKVNVAMAPEADGFSFNDWCGYGVCVNHADGTKSYYQWGGASVSWGWDIDDDKVDESAGGVTGDTWLGTVAEGAVVLDIPVEKGAVVDFYTLAWDSYTGTQYTLTINDSVKAVEPTVKPDEPAVDPDEPTVKPDEPAVKPDDSNNNTSSGNDGDAAPFAALFVTAIAALGVVAASSKRKNA